MNSWWSAIRKRLSALRHLRSPGEAVLLLQVFLFAAAAPHLLRLPLPRLRTLLEPRRPLSLPDPARVRQALRCVDLALAAGGPLLRPGCLTRGLTRYYFFRRAGLEVTLCFGLARQEDGGFAGHCWLVKDGAPYLEARDPDRRFTPVYCLGPSERTANGRCSDAKRTPQSQL